MKNCVYRIVNINNNKVYIGSTIDSERRSLEHFSHLERGVHINTYLQRAYNKHGKNMFIFDIIEGELEDSELLKREQHYMDLFNSSNSNFGYNISSYANQPDGRKHIKVFAVTQRDMLKDKKLSVNAMALLLTMQCYIEQYTNRVAKPNGTSFTNIDLGKLVGLSSKTLKVTLNELEEKQFILRVGKSRAREFYFNPNLATRGSEVQIETFNMFK